MRHFYPITVAAVGQGAIRGSDGKTLTCIGSMPVQVGDTVYTDGNVVYGHSPIKASGAVFKAPDILVSFLAHYVSWRVFEMSDAGGYTKSGNLRKNVNTLRENLYRCRNWLYTYKDRFYYDDSQQTPSGVGDYIDIWCSDNAVYTAEFSGSDAPIFAKMPTWEGNSHSVASIALNIIFLENGNGGFTPSYLDGGEARSNPIINIKRNGAIIKSFNLGDYQFALNLLKEIYLQYDEPQNQNYTRYHWQGYFTDDGSSNSEYVEAQDIYVASMYTQLLSFSFTGNGAWEMILLSMVEGSVSPHTVDEEWNSEEEEYEDVYSVYSISCPVIYLIVKVKSDGTQSILQQRVYINAIEDNAVTNRYWTNAKAYPVENVALVNEPYFTVNFGDCALTTNLRSIGTIVDSHGNTIMGGQDLMTFERLCTTNPDSSKAAVGAIRSHIIYNLSLGTSYIVDGNVSFLGIDSNNTYAPVFKREGGKVIVNYAKNCTSMLERLSFYKFTNSTYLVCIRNNTLWYVNRRAIVMAYYPVNVNLDLARIKRQKDCLDISDLINAVTGNA